jgi:hypothetical protein
MLGCRYHLRQLECGLSGGDAAAARTDVDFHQHPHFGLEFRERVLQLDDVARIVYAHRKLRLPRKRRQPAQLGKAHHLVGDEDIAYAAGEQRFGFGHLLAADADSAERHLLERDNGRLVGLRMRAQCDGTSGDHARQRLQIALEGVEIDDKRGGIDFGERRADLGRRTLRHERSS